MMHPLRIVSLNIRGLRDLSKRSSTFHHLRSFDICFLQETHCSSAAEAEHWARFWGGTSYFTAYSALSSGCAVLINRRCNFVLSSCYRDPHGRLVCVRGSLSIPSSPDPIPVLLCAVYAPTDPQARVQFFSTLPDLPCFDLDDDDDADRSFFIGGDFNCISDATLDKVGGNPAHGLSGIASLEAFTQSLDLADSFRFLHPDLVSPTWSNNAVATRIDRIYIPTRLLPALTSTTHTPFFLSDHSEVLVELDLSPRPRGSSYWKLNVSLLKNPLYVARIEDVLRLWVLDRPRFSSPSSHWDSLKMRVRTVSRALASDFKLLATAKLRAAARAREDALAAWASSPSDSSAAAVVETTQALFELQRRSLEGSLVRSRVKWTLEGERPTKYFLALEKSQAASSIFSSIRRADGSLATSPRAMAAAAADFYATLFTPDSPVDAAALADMLRHLPSLPAADAAPLSAPLTLHELTAAAKSAPHGRAPGPDGLPAEFYTTFWPILGPPFLSLVVWCLENAQPLPSSTRSSVLSLLYKKGDRSDLGNWRPIALMNADAKIFSRLLTLRLKPFIPTLVRSDQAGFVHGRLITDHILSAQLALDQLSSSNAQGGLLLLDQAKAFDRVDWTFRDAVLSRLGIPQSFLDMVQCLHRGIASSVQINGTMSRQFPLLRGTRQGDPLSPLLFILCDEAFACSLRASSLRGLPTPIRPLRLLQYADDKAIGISSPEDMACVSQLLSSYSAASGARVNTSKSEFILLPASSMDMYWRSVGLPLVLPGSSTRYLGRLIGCNVDPSSLWEGPCAKFIVTLSRWKHRDLSLSGRVTVARSLACSQLWFVGSTSFIPPALLASITKALFEFIWRSSRGAVNRDLASAPRPHGGLDVPDIAHILQAFLIRILFRVLSSLALDDTDRPLWTLIFEHRVASNSKVTSAYASFFDLLLQPPGVRRLRGLLGPSLRLFADAISALRILRPEPKPPDIVVHVLPFKDSTTPKPTLSALASTSAIARTLAASRRALPDFPALWHTLLNTTPVPSVSKVFHSVWHRARPRRESDTLWRACHNRLWVGERLRHFSDVEFCASCPSVVETEPHLFISCPVAVQAWDELSSILSAYSGTRVVITPESRLLGIKPPIQRGFYLPASLWHAAHSAVFSSLWFMRCRAVHDLIPFTSAAVIESAKARLLRILPASSLFTKVDIPRLRALL